VMKHWYLGLQKQRDYHGTVELKLGGCPWWADSNDAVESRYFISTLIGKGTLFLALCLSYPSTVLRNNFFNLYNFSHFPSLPLYNCPEIVKLKTNEEDVIFIYFKCIRFYFHVFLLALIPYPLPIARDRSTVLGLLKVNGWQVCGTMDLTRYVAVQYTTVK
jgi:hypothetical protein